MNDYNIGDLVKVKTAYGTLPVKSGSIGLITKVKGSVLDEVGYFVFFDEKVTFLMYHKELELVS